MKWEFGGIRAGKQFVEFGELGVGEVVAHGKDQTEKCPIRR